MKKIILFFIAGLLMFSIGFTQTTDLNVGAKHNQVVDYLNAYDFTGKTQDAFLDDVFYYTGKLYDNNAFPAGKGGIWGEIWFCGKGSGGGESRFQTYESALSALVSEGKISAASKDFLNSLMTQTETLQDYTAFTAKINQLENAYGIANLPETERNIVQGAVSVCKQSAFYWNNYYSPAETTPEPQGRFNIRCFWCVLKKDVFGALIGYIMGVCICKKLGVPNPQICGAVGATVFGALYSWAAKVCPDICIRCKKPNPNSYPSWICRLPFLYL